MASPDAYVLPADLPVPEDDGAADHLVGRELALRRGCRLGRRARHCERAERSEAERAQAARTPRCAFRDRFPELGVPVAGLSAQPLEDQVELAERNRMPFPVIADPERRLGAALGLPAFDVFPPDENAHDVVRWLQSR